MEFTRWKYIPLDLLQEIFMYLNTTRDIENFCKNSDVYNRVGQNGEIWKKLFNRDLSNIIKLREGETIKSQYLKDLKEWEKPTIKLSLKFYFVVNNDYEHLASNINYNILDKSIIEEGLNHAASLGCINIIRFILENGIIEDLNEVSSGTLTSAILVAVQNNHSNVIKYLWKNGADKKFVYSLSSTGHMISTPIGELVLINAALQTNISIVEYLIDNGIDIDSAIISSTRGLSTDRLNQVIDILNIYRK